MLKGIGLPGQPWTDVRVCRPDTTGYLNDAYDDAENSEGSQQSDDRGHRHIDLWTGTNIHRPADYDVPYL